MNSLSEEIIFHINQSNKVHVQFWLLQYSVSVFSIFFLWEVSYII